MNEPTPTRRVQSNDRALVTVLLLLCAVPTIAGLYRLATIAGALTAGSEAARLLLVAPPLAAHIVSACAFSTIGALQVAPGLRARHPRMHRAAGVVAASAGLVAALSGTWLTANITPGAHDGAALFWMRLIVGATMVSYLVLGVAALRRRQYAAHGRWMLRAYALGLGAGTQVFTHLAIRALGMTETTDNRAFAMGAGWLVNAVVGEWIIRSEHAKRSRSSSPVREKIAPKIVATLVAVCLVGNAASASADDTPAPSKEAPAPDSSSDASVPPGPLASAVVAPSAPLPSPAPSPSPLAPDSAARTPAAAAPTKEATAAKPTHERSPGSGVVGLRITYMRSDSVAAKEEAASLVFGGHLEAHNDESALVAYRGALDFALGGGSAKVDGLFGGALLVGLRLPVSAHHAPFVRLGFGGEFQGNERYLYSRFDLPLTEVGYQYIRGAALLEVGVRLSPVLTGRFRSNADTRVLSSAFSYGAFAAAQLEYARFDAKYTRIDARDGLGGAVDTVQGLGCVLPGTWLAICLDGQLVRSELSGAAGGVVGSGYVGALIGVGGVNGKERAAR